MIRSCIGRAIAGEHINVAARISRRAKATSRSGCSTTRRRTPSRTSSASPRGRRNGPTREAGEKVKQPVLTTALIFHRVIAGFMIQGGDPLGHRHRRPGLQVRRRVPARSCGTTRRASCRWPTRGPNTNGGQFFITLVPTPWLDNKHSVFGEVVEGHGRRPEDRQHADAASRATGRSSRSRSSR